MAAVLAASTCGAASAVDTPRSDATALAAREAELLER